MAVIIESTGIPTPPLLSQPPRRNHLRANLIALVLCLGICFSSWKYFVSLSASSVQEGLQAQISVQGYRPHEVHIEVDEAQTADIDRPKAVSLHECPGNMEIISASYGPLDVTEKMRRFATSNVTPTTKARSFSVTNTFFGGDPMYNSGKAFIMVWRPSAGSQDNVSKTRYALRTTRALENELVTINYLEHLQLAASYKKTSPFLISASYYNLDVTDIVASQLAANPMFEIQATNEAFGSDPAPGWVKTLSLTYAYIRPDGSFDYQSKVLRENQKFLIPPELTIHAANWGGLDITNTLRAQINPDQTLRLDTSRPLETDPWYGVVKTLAVVYSYRDSRDSSLQLLVSHDSAGIVYVSPTGPFRRILPPNFTHNFDDKRILAIVWENHQLPPQQVSPHTVASLINGGFVPCGKETFGGEYHPRYPRTCQVFWRVGGTGPVQCTAAREGEMLHLGK